MVSCPWQELELGDHSGTIQPDPGLCLCPMAVVGKFIMLEGKSLDGQYLEYLEVFSLVIEQQEVFGSVYNHLSLMGGAVTSVTHL